MKRIVSACYPDTLVEARRLWHDMRPVKFTNIVTYDSQNTVTLARYQIPADASYLLILRVDCYVNTPVATAPGYALFGPPPVLATGFWQYQDFPGLPEYRLTNVVPLNLLANVDEFLFATGDHTVALIGNLPAPTDTVIRYVATTVYAYNVGPLIADRLGGNETTYSATGSGTQVTQAPPGSLLLESDQGNNTAALLQENGAPILREGA